MAKKPLTKQFADKVIELDYKDHGGIYSYAFSADGKYAISGAEDKTVRLWDMETGQCLRVMEGHTDAVCNVAFSADQRYVISGSDDNTVRLWDVELEQCLRVMQGHTDRLWSVAWSPDLRYALSGSSDETIRLWDVKTGDCLREFKGHTGMVLSVAWSVDQRYILSGADDKTVRLWDVKTGNCLRVLEDHTNYVLSVAFSADQRHALSGSYDNTIRLWDVETGCCLRVLEGHTNGVNSVVFSTDQHYALSGSYDDTVRLWDMQAGICLHVLEGHSEVIQNVAWGTDLHHAFSGDKTGGIRVWDLSKIICEILLSPPEQLQYTSAKVLLVGETSAGKTGLSKVLAGQPWEASDSTVGAWATQWKLPVSAKDGIVREIWLWDFGGQADQRLIHQLYMDETALAVLVFDGQKADLFETLGQWDHDLSRASSKPFTKLLAAGRIDTGGLKIGRETIKKFAKQRGFVEEVLETSAKTGQGCAELKQAIIDGIRWENIPWRSSPRLFKRLKEEIIRLKDEDRVMLRFNELRDTLKLRLSGKLSGKDAQFTDEQLKAVITLLAGPGVVWELKFGGWVLLQPERINAYAQAVIQTMRMDQDERGCLPEQQILDGNLIYHASMTRLETNAERIILLAMHQTLVERGLCLREQTEQGALLIFPSYYQNERPDLIGHPSVLVSYRFNGFIEAIYTTLVVKLLHTAAFTRDNLWRYATDFKTPTRKKLGVKLTRLAEGAGELDVYFDPSIEMDTKITFSKYVHEHILKNAKDVERLRYYVCPHCSVSMYSRKAAMKKLAEGKKSILCVECEKRIPLWDDLEELFASDKIKQQVRDLEDKSARVLDHASNERILVGEVISTVADAGQISRELIISDHGIDMEIEFKSDNGETTGKKLYLQLKTGDSYLYERKRDAAEIFTIKNESHAHYWMDQIAPVLLVIRNSEGDIRWMEIRDYLRQEKENGKKRFSQIIFQGEPFDVASILRWRKLMI